MRLRHCARLLLWPQQDPALLMEAGNLAKLAAKTRRRLDLFRRAVALDPVNAQARAFLAGNLSVARTAGGSARGIRARRLS